ncbi:hypothetical protein KY289_007592 [Solanum tuberosum]|nr:hypothetical protein KY289_007592 [Solanum tuberosum]
MCLNPLRYDPSVNLLIVTFGGRLQVHRLHPTTSVFTLFFMMDTFQLFGSVLYILPTVEPAKSLIEIEPTFSIWNSGFSFVFMIVKGSSDKVEISEFILSPKFWYKILERLVGNQLRAARRQNKWMALSSPTYFVCNIFTKALYSVSPNNDSGSSITLQPYSYSSLGLDISLTFANHPFDPGIHDIPLSYGANESMFPNSSSVPYLLVVTLWGEQVYCLGQNHVGTDASEHFNSSLEFLLAFNHVGLVQHIWKKQWKALFGYIDPDYAYIFKLQKARQWKGLEHNPTENLISLFTIPYRGGHLDRRYYGGHEYIGNVESPYQSRHLEHDYPTGTKMFFWCRNVFQEQVMQIDCKQLEKCAIFFRPKLIVTGASTYSRRYDYARLRKVCNKQEVFLLEDTTHLSGLVASWVM